MQMNFADEKFSFPFSILIFKSVSTFRGRDKL